MHVRCMSGAVRVLIVAAAALLQVLDKDGSGSWSSVMCGINWVATNWNTVSPPIKVGRPLRRAGAGTTGCCILQLVLPRKGPVVGAAGRMLHHSTGQP